MKEDNPLYEAAYQTALVMRDKKLKPEEKEKLVNKQIARVEEIQGSFLEYQLLLSEALKFTGEEEKGI